jgi:hypothetical protein
VNTANAQKTAFIVTIFFSAAAFFLPINSANANPMTYPPAPSTDLPTLVIQTPENYSDTYAGNTLELNFTITKPKSWDSYGGIMSMPAVGYYTVMVYLDETQKYLQPNLGSPGRLVANYVAVFKNLTTGQHTIKIDVLANTLYGYEDSLDYRSDIVQTVLFRIDEDSKTIWFVVEPQTTERAPYPSYLLPLLPLPSPTPSRYQVKDPITIRLEDPPPPEISNLSVANQTFSSKDIPLSFNVNVNSTRSWIAWMAYSLDNQANITTEGNTTLFGVSEGVHGIVVYANNSEGYMSASEAVNFTVTLPPTPSLTPTPIPTPSATEQPTKAPETEVKPSSLPTEYLVGIAAAVAVGAVAASAFVLRKRYVRRS